MTKGKGCLIVVAIGLGLLATALALVGPTVLREGEKLYRPIARMQGAQTEFETWTREHPFKAPAEIALSAGQLEAFLKLRRRLDAVAEENPLPDEGTGRRERPSISEIEGMLEGVGGAVSGRMDAYRESGMPPDEYRYIERVVYRQWLRPLREKGSDPAAVARAAKEVTNLAAGETNATVKGRLQRLAQDLAERRVPPPPGFPPEIHALLLGHAAEIDALLDEGPSVGSRRGRGRIDF